MKKKFNVLITILLIVVFCFPIIINANNSGAATGGTPGKTGSTCPNCSWVYNFKGLRFSLYKYNGTKLSYHGSTDYCASSTCWNWPTNVFQLKKTGKLAYQNLSNTYNASANWKKSTISIKSNSDFQNKDYIEYGYIGSGLNTSVKNFLKLNGNNNTDVLNQINAIFSNANLTLSDLGSVYITVEPTLYIVETGKKNRYYGTIYELNKFFSDGANLGGTDGKSGINAQIYRDTAEAVMTSKIEGGKDQYNLVGNLVKLVPSSNLAQSVANNKNNRINNVNKITSKDGYGIAVYWLGNYASASAPVTSCTISESYDKTTYTLNVTTTDNNVFYDINSSVNLLNHESKNKTYIASYKDQTVIGKVYNSNGNEVATCSLSRTIQTCSQTCAGKSGDSLLGCAEEYCQAMSDDSSEKRTCIKTCGYIPTTGGEEPAFSSCGANTKTDGVDTVCDQNTTASNKTCTKATTSNYFKTVCTDESTIKYGTSLPVMVNPGLGFSYTPTVSGNKTCEMVFEAEKWKFDYAASYTQEERDVLLGILNQYNNVSDTSIWAQDIRDVYKYKSNDANIEIQITNNNDLSASDRITTKKLIVDKTKNLLDKEVKVSSAGTVTIPLFANGIKTIKTIFGLIKTTSSNETTYKLPGVCINSRNGTLYSVGYGDSCDSANDGPYYEYYTDLKINAGIYDTETNVNKTTSNLSVKNTCNYAVSSSSKKSVSCSIAVIDCENNIPTKAELRIENKNNLNISYGLSSSSYSLNGIKELNVTSNMKNLYGSIGIGGRIVATCSKDLTVPTCTDKPEIEDGGDYNCKRDYKPSEYSKISEYCNSHWMEDAANYSSEKDCYNSCSSGSNTCKNNPEVDTSSRISVEQFCSIKENREANGYNKANYDNPLLNDKHNMAMCINDCYTPGPVVPPGTTEPTDPPGGVVPPGTTEPSNPSYPDDILDDDDKAPCLGIVCDYLYRPISLKDPFPNNRDAGYNWYGKEIFITDDLLNPHLNKGAEAEYVIELTPDIIDSINRDTDNYNRGRNKNAYIDYVYNDDDDINGKYVSKFIHSNDETNGGFSRYFTKILN